MHWQAGTSVSGSSTTTAEYRPNTTHTATVSDWVKAETEAEAGAPLHDSGETTWSVRILVVRDEAKRTAHDSSEGFGYGYSVPTKADLRHRRRGRYGFTLGSLNGTPRVC
jgi:hypothetical protein